ncbi:MAG TPA: cytochrome c maturation protein CcmE [Thermoanaerobaculia bacterium]|nr:cytochrome c maturation protein CcmE [Thermoanaerobaculia bacterium]HQR67106.1 cytochrome c maturation protein CcmE [Thermoanaerobaculia bacterium]
MKKAYWIGAVVVLAFLALGLSTFTKSMTPYVSFDEAKSSKRTVQVMGALEKGSTRYDTGSKTLHFSLVDEKTRTALPVTYRDVKPANFEEAVSIVAIGRYHEGAFQAEKLLVKCPSKYQGEEVEKQYGKKA